MLKKRQNLEVDGQDLDVEVAAGHQIYLEAEEQMGLALKTRRLKEETRRLKVENTAEEADQRAGGRDGLYCAGDGN